MCVTATDSTAAVAAFLREGAASRPMPPLSSVEAVRSAKRRASRRLYLISARGLPIGNRDRLAMLAEARHYR